jgi:hypothetical protein
MGIGVEVEVGVGLFSWEIRLPQGFCESAVQRLVLFEEPVPPLFPAGMEPTDTIEHIEFARTMDDLRQVAHSWKPELAFGEGREVPSRALPSP